MDDPHLYISKVGAEKLLTSINKRFPNFYKEKTKEDFTEHKSQHIYWASQVGEFLRGWSKETLVYTKDGEPDGQKMATRFYDKSYLSEATPILTDASVLYKDLYLFIKRPKGPEVSIPFSTIEGLFSHFFIDEKEKKPETFGTWESQVQGNGLNSKSVDEEFDSYKKILRERSWSLFSFWESPVERPSHIAHTQPANGAKWRGIRQSIVRFSGTNRIQIGNITGNKDVNHYEGEYHFRKENNYLYLETKPLKINSEHYFRLMLYFGREDIDEVALGVYYNVRRLGSLVCGSALLVENPAHLRKVIESTECIIYDLWEALPAEFETVRQYLERRNLNYIKLPSKLDPFKLYELKETLDELKKKESQWDIRLYKYDYFLSIPLTYNNSETIFSRNTAIARQLIELLEEQYPNNRHSYACEKINSYEDYKNLSDEEKYIKALTAIEQSKNFIWLYPKSNLNQPQDDNNHQSVTYHISSAIIELGYAMGLKKPIIIFYDRNEEMHLPTNLQDYKPLVRIPFNSTSDDGIKQSFGININTIKKGMKLMVGPVPPLEHPAT